MSLKEDFEEAYEQPTLSHSITEYCMSLASKLILEKMDKFKSDQLGNASYNQGLIDGQKLLYDVVKTYIYEDYKKARK